MDKINRNDPCPCGSGKKYKKCCALKATSKRKRHFSSLKGSASLVPQMKATADKSLAHHVFKLLTSSMESEKKTPSPVEHPEGIESPKSYQSLEELIGLEGTQEDLSEKKQT
jgi:hypothetical protein